MNIGMILDNEFTGDLRVENEVFSLCNSGFNVFVLCFNHGGKSNLEDFHGGKIVRIDISKFKKNKMKGLTNTIFDFYKMYWARHIKAFVKKYKIDVLHAHDLYMLGPAFRANKSLPAKLPVIGDLHENFPAALKYYKYSTTFPGKYIISIPKWERTEINWVNKADHVITVIEEAKTRYINLGLEKDKISVVANYVNPDFFLEKEAPEHKQGKFIGKFVISYAGGFDTHRGLESVIRSLSLLKKEIPNIMLVLIGAGINEEDLKKLTTSLNLENHVSFEGWVLPSKLPAYIDASDVCLIPHLKTEHTDNTLPHKLFQYMLLKKPVLSTNCDPLKRILEETNSGLVYTSNDEADIAKQLKSLYKNPELMKQMGENGKQAVIEKYNWDQTAKTLINLYHDLDQKK